MEKTLHYTIVDAFTSTPFGGNPAAVIVLPPSSTLPDSLTQQIASEFNLSETAFLVPKTTHSTVDGSSRTYGLRWFTPSVEVPLCGHATLASARVLFSDPSLTPESVTTLKFETLSGVLTAKKVEGGRKIELELPTIVGAAVTGDHAARVAEAVSEAVGGSVGIRGVQKEDAQAILLVQVDPAFDLEGAKVDATPFLRLQDVGVQIVVLTSDRPTPGGHKFISRVFAPGFGIAEDPVTGMAHCALTPYWSRVLDIPAGEVIPARQVSRRGGELELVWDEAKGTVKLRGDAVVVARGEMYVG